MAATIQVRRGLETNLPILSQGELGFTTDTHKTYIGDGSTNHLLGSSAVVNIGDILNPICQLPLTNGFNMPYGKGDVTFTRSTIASYIDNYGVLKYVAIDEPRFEKEGFLNEYSSTNQAIQSEDFSDTAWAKQYSSITINDTDAPDENTTADKLVEDSNNNLHRIYQSYSFAASTTYTISIFAKKGERDHIRLNAFGTLSAAAFFDLTNGVIDNLEAGTASITRLKNDWYRCSVTGTTASSPGTVIYYEIATDSTTNTYTGDGSSGIYIWGAQIEDRFYATSYIKTDSSSKTRSYDNCYITADGNIPNTIEDLTILLDIKSLGNQENRSQIFLYIDSENDALYGMLHQHTNNNSWIRIGGSTYTSVGDLNGNQFYRLGARSLNGNVNMIEDGTLSTITNPITNKEISADNKLYIGSSGSSGNIDGHIRNFRIFNKGLTTEELEIA